MVKPANKKRGEVAVPALGDGVLRFTVDSLERLESELGPKWLDAVLEGLADCRISTVKLCCEVGLIGGPRRKIDGGAEEVDFSAMRDVDSVRAAIYDALFLMLYGKTFEEKRAEEEAKQHQQFLKQMGDIKENPQIAALLSSRLFGEPATEPDSDPTKSAASPQ